MYKATLALTPLVLAAAGQAQFAACSITDGPATYRFTSQATSCTSTSGLANFDAGGGNNLFQHWWYACIDGGPVGCALNNVTNSCAGLGGRVGSVSSADWDGSGKIAARWTVHVYATGAASGIAASRMTIVNTSSAPVRVVLYGYTDVDNGGAGGDSPNPLAGWPVGNHSVTDPSSPETMYVTALNFDAWEIAQWSSLRTKIINTSGTGCAVLANAVVGTPPYDYTSAFAWQRTLMPNESYTACMAIGYDQEPPCQNHAEATTYCRPKPGTNGLPAWNTLSQPFVGSAAPLGISNGFPGSPPVVAIGTMQAAIVLPPIGVICVLPILTTVGLPPFDAAGNSGINVPIPNSSALCNARLYMQGFFADPGAAAGIAHTDGLCWTFGSF